MKAFRKKPATYDDIRKLPEMMIGELIGGELVASPRPSSAHSNVAGALTEELRGPFQRGRGGPGGWWILYEPELHIGENVLVPDFAGWRRERLPRMSDVPFLEIAPDWLCEILSPSTAGFDRVRKLPIYLREGVNHVWLIDPTARTLEAYRREGEKWVLIGNFAGDQQARIEPFEAHEIDLKSFWLEEEPP
jgi:Uma2 family endonuclease